MKFQVAKQDLEHALHVVAASVSSSGTDISSHIVFRLTDTGDGPGVEALSYSGKVFSSCVVGKARVLDVADPAIFTVEAKRLRAWLVNVGGSAIMFDGSKQGLVVVDEPDTGAQRFQSLDPQTFPFWDKTFAEATLTATLPAARLAQAMSYAKMFVSTNESSAPHMCVFEARRGCIFATDKKSATLIEVKGLENSNLRVHGKAAPSLISYLNTVGEGEVQVYEHERALFLKRADGALFGEARLQVRFPDLAIRIDEPDQHWWSVSKADMLRAMGILASGAAQSDNVITLSRKGGLCLTMMNLDGSPVDKVVSCLEEGSLPGAPDLPGSFNLDRHSLLNVLSAWSGDTVRIGINRRSSSGYVRFLEEQNEDRYLTVMAWLAG